MEVEPQSLLIAMHQAWIRGHRKVFFEGDNQMVVSLFNGAKQNSKLHNWIREINGWKQIFDSYKATWINRVSNKAADRLV